LDEESISRKLIESWIPLSKVNEDSNRERAPAFGRGKPPKIHNLHTYFARRPTGPARVLTLSAVLPDEVSRDVFLHVVGFNRVNSAPYKLLYMVSPNREGISKLVKQYLGRESGSITVVDPMAGGGSIPLEALRLGFKTIAVEYNPLAYLILKATIEFPAKYADAGLFEETVNAARKLLVKAKEELEKYYGTDAENYIFARGVRCPYCNGLIPIYGLGAQITQDSDYKRRYIKLEFDKERRTFIIETTDEKQTSPLKKRGLMIECPYCGKKFQLRGKSKTGSTAFDRWFQEHAKSMRSVVEEYAEVTPDMEHKLIELHIPLIKQVGDEFIPVWGNEDEEKRFMQAFRDLSKEILELQDYIPVDEIPAENKWASTARNKGLTHWYMLFNPRQLLTIAKLTKIIANMAEDLASKNGEFGAAVSLYLALALDKLADYNTIATKWQGTKGKTGIGNTFRGESTIDFRLEYCEIKRIDLALDWVFETDTAVSRKYMYTRGGMLPVLRSLTDEFRGAGLGDKVEVYLADATRLSDVLGIKSVDVVNVDPPYFEQVIYSDRSEFFWVMVRRALRPVLELLFKPGLKLSSWSWTSSTLPREREVVTFDKEDSSGRFRKLFKEFINETYKVLKDDGTLVLWFTHPTDIAWGTIGEALYDAGYVVSKVWPVITEAKTRYKGIVNVVAQETSLIIVARKRPRKMLTEVGADIRSSLLRHPEFVEAVKIAVEEARKVAKEAGASPADMMSLMLGSALSVVTRFDIPADNKFVPLFDTATTLVIEQFIAPVIKKVLTEIEPARITDEVEASRVAEYVRRAMVKDSTTRSYITLWFLSRVDLETGRYRQTPLPMSYDFAQTTTKILGHDIDKLGELGLVGESTVEEDNEEEELEEEEETPKRRGKAFYPLMFEALTTKGAKTTWSNLSTTVPGRALYVAYLALNESGTPQVRAETIRKKLSTWSNEELAEAAAIGVILLKTARDVDLGLKQGPQGLDKYMAPQSSSSDAKAVRELAIRTLLNLIPK
jgi:adenine-specific DNA methylase